MDSIKWGQGHIDVRWLFPSSRTSAKTGHRSHIKSPGKAIKRVVEQEWGAIFSTRFETHFCITVK